MRFKKKLTIMALFFFVLNLNSYEKYIDMDLIKNADKPKLVNDGVLFTFEAKKGSYIFLRTSLDNFSIDHYYKVSQYGIYYTFIKITDDTKSFKYRININGYWINDPYNDNYIEDMYGTYLYVIEIPDEIRYHESMPIIEDTDNKIKKVTFKYYNPSANEVNFVCSVDNWTQYSHPMIKEKFGYWTITKSFSKGMYLYFFYVDGNHFIDLDNSNKTLDEKKGEVSYFIIK